MNVYILYKHWTGKNQETPSLALLAILGSLKSFRLIYVSFSADQSSSPLPSLNSPLFIRLYVGSNNPMIL